MSDPLIEAIRKVEEIHFRTVADTGAHMNAMIVMNTFRGLAGLARLQRDDLPSKVDANGESIMPEHSLLLANSEDAE